MFSTFLRQKTTRRKKLDLLLFAKGHLFKKDFIKKKQFPFEKSKIDYLCSPKGDRSLFFADVMKLVDMLDLGSSASRRVGSSPSIRTILMV